MSLETTEQTLTEKILAKLDEVEQAVKTLNDFDNGWPEFISETHDKALTVIGALHHQVVKHKKVGGYGRDVCEECSKDMDTLDEIPYPCEYIAGTAVDLGIDIVDTTTTKYRSVGGV